LIDDAKRGLADITAGRTFEADAVLAQLQQQRKTAIKLPAKQRG
jgi:predicted transcriptional regulator